MIAIERKRTERSKAPFLLMLLEVVSDDGAKKNRKTLDLIAAALLASSRDTDLVGWYKDNGDCRRDVHWARCSDKRTMLDTFLDKGHEFAPRGTDSRAVQSGQHFISLVSGRLGS